MVSNLSPLLYPAFKVIFLSFHMYYWGPCFSAYHGQHIKVTWARMVRLSKLHFGHQLIHKIFLHTIQIHSEKGKGQRKKSLTTFRGTHNTFHPPVSYLALSGEVAEPKFTCFSFTIIPNNNCGLKAKYCGAKPNTSFRKYVLNPSPPLFSLSSGVWELEDSSH